MAAAAAPDHLFNLRNNFYLGAYQAAINNSDLTNLSPDDAVERDCLVYRSYIALGSYQVPWSHRHYHFLYYLFYKPSIYYCYLFFFQFHFWLFFSIEINYSLWSVRSMSRLLLLSKPWSCLLSISLALTTRFSL